MEIWLIRHGKTPGNELGRYIGTTDESLSESGRKALEGREMPAVDKVYTSTLKRTIETAQIFYPKMQPVSISLLNECDFGDFENKNYKELDGNQDYQDWIDSNGTLPFPNGEAPDTFKQRCIEGFKTVLDDAKHSKARRIALVVHGGTIMSIMEAYDGGDYYSYQIKNGESLYLHINDK